MAGDPRAEAFLSEFYRSGLIGPSDPVKFRFWALKAAQHGMYRAQGDLGYALLVGYGGPQDRIEAMKWMLVAEKRAPKDDTSFGKNKINLANARLIMSASDIAMAEQRAAAEISRQEAPLH